MMKKPLFLFIAAALLSAAAPNGGRTTVHAAEDRQQSESELQTASHAGLSKNTDTQSAGILQSELTDGEYAIQLECEGGSGKASVVSPTLFTVLDGQGYAQIQWSSSNYDYMIVDGTTYLNENTDGGNSLFTVPVSALDTPLSWVADTTAMGTPHEITYQFTFYSDSIDSKSALPQEAAKKMIAIAIVIIVGGGILNHILKKRRS